MKFFFNGHLTFTKKNFQTNEYMWDTLRCYVNFFSFFFLRGNYTNIQSFEKNTVNGAYRSYTYGVRRRIKDGCVKLIEFIKMQSRECAFITTVMIHDVLIEKLLLVEVKSYSVYTDGDLLLPRPGAEQHTIWTCQLCPLVNPLVIAPCICRVSRITVPCMLVQTRMLKLPVLCPHSPIIASVQSVHCS